ncbi:hypothetical protein AVEN_92979-1 [Araneus ventricosus]|uniref:Uncharacterized protein n=1 Tax=Araneus ventricosus TaxID=182803 RepID=A0A4Y2JMA6_ARAVE|nr:hypothetical protein AVEN_92979-1 [Araneus ventricosus]
MRSCRISKQVLASPVGTLMVVWLFGPIPMTGRTPVKWGVIAFAARNEGYYAGTTVPDYLSRRMVIHVNPDAKTRRDDSLRLYAYLFLIALLSNEWYY